MQPELKGIVTLAVPGEHEVLEIPGERFTWEEGGEHDTSYMFIDHETDVSVTVNVEEGRTEFFDFYQDGVKLDVVEPTTIEANDALMAHTPDDF